MKEQPGGEARERILKRLTENYLEEKEPEKRHGISILMRHLVASPVFECNMCNLLLEKLLEIENEVFYLRNEIADFEDCIVKLTVQKNGAA